MKPKTGSFSLNKNHLHLNSNLLFLAVGLFLAVAAILKSLALIERPLLPWSTINSRLLQAFVVSAEFGLAVFCLRLKSPRLIRTVLMFVFGMFFVLSCYELIIGNESCGCFGQHEVHPGAMAVLNFCILVCVGLCRPEPPAPVTPMNALFISLRELRTSIAASLLVAICIYSLAPANFSPISTEEWRELDVVELRPGEWVGRTFPLSNFIKNNEVILSSDCLLLIYHDSCHDCLKAAKQMDMLASRKNFSTSLSLVALEVAPSSSRRRIRQRLSPAIEYRALSSTKEWFIKTPSVLLMRRGKVRRVYDQIPEPAEID